jgi:hypothetical protein
MRFNLLPLKLTTSLFLFLLLIPIQLISQSTEKEGPYLAPGIRIGDVSQTEAIRPEHLNLNVTVGTMSVSIYPAKGGSISVKHYSVDGVELNESRSKAN